MSKKILIVEDDVLLSDTLAMSLKDEGYETFQAYDGAEGLSLAEKNMPDLVLCDINMPTMDGITMLKKIRATSWGENLKFIMLTNFSDEEKVFEVLKNHVFTYLVKSDWELDRIIEKIKEQTAD